VDQTIKQILELDAATEQRLRASQLVCEQKRQNAIEQAEAIRQAQAHQTRDTIFEFEEQTRAECERKLAEQQLVFDRQADAITKQFEGHHEALLESLYEETLREAER